MAQTIFKRGIALKLRNLILPQPKFEEQYCRLCLSSDDTEFKQLFSPFNTRQNIVEVIEDFAKVSILSEDEHSKLICCSCFIKLTETQNFKYLIENSDFKLRNRQTRYEDPLDLDSEIGDNDNVFDEDSDHVKIDVDETDFKKEEINRGVQLVKDNGPNNIVELKEISDHDDNVESNRHEFELIELNETRNLEVVEIKVKTKKRLKQERKGVETILLKTKIKKENAPRKIKKKRIKKDYQLKCPQCDRVFKRHESLKRHLINHSGLYPLHCSFCNKGFITKSELSVHETNHTEKRDYQCEKCGKSFKQASSLITHKKTHEDEKQFKCDQCTKEFRSKHILMLHIASIHVPNTDRPNFVCQICNKTYPTQFQFNMHTKKAHQERKRVTCDICGKSVANYYNHKKSHTKPYKCGVCNQSFSHSKTLRGHSAVHTGERLYKCDICLKTFGFSSVLQTHKRIHDLTKRLKCEFCDKIFVYKHHLKGHVEKVHLKDLKC